MWYRLDANKNPVPCDRPTDEDWEGGNRIVKQEDVGPYFVSTVFLMLDHGFGDEGRPVLFETMVFKDGSGHDEDMERCCTWDEAVEQHKRMVEKYRAKE